MATRSVFTDSCDLLFSATGALNEWKWPDIPGLDKFRGKLLHSANWDEDYDYQVASSFSTTSKASFLTRISPCKNETVAVIGSGSSAIQIVPGIQKAVKHLDSYVRGRTWIATPFAAKYVNARGSEANCKSLPAHLPLRASWLTFPQIHSRKRKSAASRPTTKRTGNFKRVPRTRKLINKEHI